MYRPKLSVLIPTYNAAETLELTLKSLRAQGIPADEMEILVVDGGSTDDTVKIALQYDCIILENPKRLPGFAMGIGIHAASGHYLLKTASDESLLSNTQLQKRFDYFERHPDVACIGSDRLLSPPYDKYNFSRSYLNRFGDPFTAFVYNTKDGVLQTFSNLIIDEDEQGGCVLQINEGEMYPIADGGMSLLSLDYAREHFGERMEDLAFILQVAEEIMLHTKRVGYIRGDDVLHIPKASFSIYRRKIEYRVVNNVSNIDLSGYTNVAEKVPKLKRRKYLFALYAITIILPILHSVYYAIRYRDATLFAHCIYVYITIFLIGIYMLRKALRFKNDLNTYG